MKTPPVPRDSNYMGRRTTAAINEDGTWLEPEERTYPSGGFHRRGYVILRKNEHNPIELPYGEKRIVICSIADSVWTIPARLKWKGRNVKGYISGDNNILTFTPNASDACVVCVPGQGCKRDQKPPDQICHVCNEVIDFHSVISGACGCTRDDAVENR